MNNRTNPGRHPDHGLIRGLSPIGRQILRAPSLWVLFIGAPREVGRPNTVLRHDCLHLIVTEYENLAQQLQAKHRTHRGLLNYRSHGTAIMALVVLGEEIGQNGSFSEACQTAKIGFLEPSPSMQPARFSTILRRRK